MTEKKKILTLRIPISLHEKLLDIVELSGKPMTQEIIERINNSIDAESLEDIARRIAREEIEKALSKK